MERDWSVSGKLSDVDDKLDKSTEYVYYIKALYQIKGSSFETQFSSPGFTKSTKVN